MSEDQTTPADDTRTGWLGTFWGGFAVAVISGAVAIGGLLGSGLVDDGRQDRRTDELYCTLSGVGPEDRAPNSGERCEDVND